MLNDCGDFPGFGKCFHGNGELHQSDAVLHFRIMDGAVLLKDIANKTHFTYNFSLTCGYYMSIYHCFTV